MIQSMTGFGKAEGSVGEYALTMEIRSLNSNKGLDLNIKLPSRYRALEADWRTLFAELLVRGKVDLSINARKGGVDENIDMTTLEQAYKSVEAKADTLKADKNGLLAALIPLLPTLANNETELTEEESKSCTQLLSTALKQLIAFREKEGESILADVELRLKNIQSKLAEVVARDKTRLSEVREKMAERLAAFILSEKIDASRLEQEVIFYLEKMDINEEISRLTAHCLHFGEVMDSAEIQLGRKLNFIAQEMGREINTIGSKANDFPLQKLVVEMKDELEKIKEQTSNIL